MTNGTADVYIGRYCAACGKKHEKDALSCPYCGARTDGEQYNGMTRTGAGGVGYSHKTGDPVFAQNRRKYKKYTLIISPCIAVLIALILILPGVNPVIACCVGLIILLIILPFALLSFRTKKSWEGTVTKKKHIPWRREKRSESYKIWFVTEDGKRRVQKWNVHTGMYDYLNEGDRVRYDGDIGGSFAYEKYDKSKDDNIACVSCGYLQDARQTCCTACGSPLMKGNPIF